ncbi:MAG: PorP/SprF family type IX secretion system membrane protein [Saprospiraceae bacterium]
MMRAFLLIGFLLSIVVVYGQQSQLYTQFMYTKLALNPGYAGNESYTNMALLYRDQWSGFPGSPKAQALTVNFGRIAKKLGIGANIEHQSLGITDKITYEMSYAYKFILGNGVLSMGINASGREYSQDYTDQSLFAIHGLSNDPSIPIGKVNKRLFNAGFGLYFNTNKYYLGLSVPRMIRADLDFDDNDLFSNEVRHVFVMTGGTFIVNNDVRLTPQLLIRAAESAPITMDFNISATYKNKYSFGTTYRSGGATGDLGESLDFIVGLQVSDQIMLGFAYDAGLSKIRKIENGSLEAIISYNFIPRSIKTIIVNPRYF